MKIKLTKRDIEEIKSIYQFKKMLKKQNEVKK